MATPASFPFDDVVITFPDQAAAQAAEAGPLPALQARFQCRSILATTDPYGARVGSGGGSLAALALCMEQQQQQQQSSSSARNGNILILHAGGESSRCPTQMVLGKAWTSLPCLASNRGGPRLVTPIELWLDLAQELFANLTDGSVVVAASDTLVQLFGGGDNEDGHNEAMDWESCPPTAVVGLAVPAPLETAQNHGVYVLNKDNAVKNDNNTNGSVVVPCHQVYQKPTLAQLEEFCRPFFVQNEPMAWIDTGVVVFMPQAAKALHQLAYKDLSRVCTWQGIQEAWHQQHPQREPKEDINAFAQRVAVKVDLYTHILQALQLAPSDTTNDNESDNKNNDTGHASEQWRFNRYREQHTDLPSDACRALWSALSTCPLFIASVHHGHFLHLGTTSELQEFLLQGSSSSSSFPKQTQQVADYRRNALCQRFGRELGLTRRLKAFTLLPNYNHHESSIRNEASAVLYHCILSTQHSESRLGAGSVVEHSWIETGDQPLVIGSNCLVSGLRPIRDSPRDAFVVPDGMIVQMLALSRNKSSGSDPTNYVYMTLGMKDGIKSQTTVFGRSWSDFFNWSGLSESELWDDDSSRVLWNARLHPVVSSADKLSSFGKVFSWLLSFLSGEKDKPDSWSKWRESRRLSLAQIRDEADASVEFSFREELTVRHIPDAKLAHTQAIQQTLMQRQHQPVDFEYAISECAENGCIDDMLQILLSLVDVADRSLKEGLYDVCGRSFMIQSGIFYEMDDLVHSKGLDPLAIPRALTQSSFYTALVKDSLPSSLYYASVLERVHILVDRGNNTRDTNKSSKLKAFGEISVDLAHAMTMRCVCGPRRGIGFQENSDPLFDQWVVAKSGARIDWSGGWSDTPPVCCEYGSSVTGVAVTIDGKMPFSCACRVVSGSQGIGLIVESRDINTGEILNHAKSSLTSFKDIADYHDPTADCALLKTALVCLGLLASPELAGDSETFQEALNSFCKSQEDCRLEIVSTSLLPHGSGLGTSSILGGCVLIAVGKCIGKDFIKLGSAAEELIDAVLVLEQHLTTGGGFQDQVNGLIGGMKTVRCLPHLFPVKLAIEKLQIPQAFQREFDSRVVLAFTGKTRLAKNILRSVLTRWSKRTPEIVDTVSRLVSGAEEARESIERGDFESLAKTLNDYWELKKTMAGPDSGVEPPGVKELVSKLKEKQLILGSSLCGAGGGGFLAMILNQGVTRSDIQSVIDSCALDLPDFTLHECKLSDEGCKLDILRKGIDPT